MAQPKAPSRNPSRLDLSKYDLIFCHLDLADRNVLFMDDDRICIIDWESAGFFPQIFEICALRLNARKSRDLANSLLTCYGPLNAAEEHDIKLIMEAWKNSQLYW
jgi:thiamine kinase-like enzyme